MSNGVPKPPKVGEIMAQYLPLMGHYSAYFGGPGINYEVR